MGEGRSQSQKKKTQKEKKEIIEYKDFSKGKKKTTKAKVKRAKQDRQLMGYEYNSPEERKALLGSMSGPTFSPATKKKKKKQMRIDDEFDYLNRW